MTTIAQETIAQQQQEQHRQEQHRQEQHRQEQRQAQRPGGRGSEIRRHELAVFLRSRRERITSEQVGLPRGRRRRTPGLRREEVAQLSSMGVTWYTWLEQACAMQVSEQVLNALARTLLLDPSERAHQLGSLVTMVPSDQETRERLGKLYAMFADGE